MHFKKYQEIRWKVDEMHFTTEKIMLINKRWFFSQKSWCFRKEYLKKRIKKMIKQEFQDASAIKKIILLAYLWVRANAGNRGTQGVS